MCQLVRQRSLTLHCLEGADETEQVMFRKLSAISSIDAGLLVLILLWVELSKRSPVLVRCRRKNLFESK